MKQHCRIPGVDWSHMLNYTHAHTHTHTTKPSTAEVYLYAGYSGVRTQVLEIRAGNQQQAVLLCFTDEVL